MTVLVVPVRTLLFVALVVLTMQCAEKPGIRFYPTWPDDMLLSEAWAKGDSSLAQDLLDIDRVTFLQPFGRPPKVMYGDSDFRAFTVIVKGRLPGGGVNVRADYVNENGARERAIIEPVSITFDDKPHAAVRNEPGYHAFRVSTLQPDGYVQLPRIVPGHYQVFLGRKGVVLCNGALTIRDPDDTYHGSGLLRVRMDVPADGESVRTAAWTFTATAIDPRHSGMLSEPIRLSAVLHERGSRDDSQSFTFTRDAETQIHAISRSAPDGKYLNGVFWLDLVWEDSHGDHVARSNVTWFWQRPEFLTRRGRSRRD